MMTSMPDCELFGPRSAELYWLTVLESSATIARSRSLPVERYCFAAKSDWLLGSLKIAELSCEAFLDSRF